MSAVVTVTELTWFRLLPACCCIYIWTIHRCNTSHLLTIIWLIFHVKVDLSGVRWLEDKSVIKWESLHHSVVTEKTEDRSRPRRSKWKHFHFRLSKIFYFSPSKKLTIQLNNYYEGKRSKNVKYSRTLSKIQALYKPWTYNIKIQAFSKDFKHLYEHCIHPEYLIEISKKPIKKRSKKIPDIYLILQNLYIFPSSCCPLLDPAQRQPTGPEHVIYQSNSNVLLSTYKPVKLTNIHSLNIQKCITTLRPGANWCTFKIWYN